MEQRVLITGAGGRVGRMLRARLVRPGRVLRLLDVGAQPPAGAGEEVLTGDLSDAALLAAATAGADAVVHLASLAWEDTWERLQRVNVDGTRAVLDAARAAGVPRVVLASSAHAVGFYRRPCRESGRAVVAAPPAVPAGVPAPMGADGLPASVPPRPDSYYGVSKAVVEALGALYADRFGMTVVALRLGDCAPEPAGDWALPSWLSPDDCARLIEACLTAVGAGYRTVWGISRNTRRWWSLAEGEALGYRPRDDSERFAGSVAAAEGVRAATLDMVGGRMTTVPLGVPR